MANSNTEHSKKLRRDAANRRLQRIYDEGGKRVTVTLHAPAYAVLRAECERRGMKEGTIIEKMLLELGEKA